MMNKKLIALFVAVTTISGLSAEHCYTDRNGVRYCDGIVRNTGRVAGTVVEGTGEAAGTVVGGTADVVGGTIGGIFGGRGVRERIEDRKIRKESRDNSYYAREAEAQRNGNTRNLQSGNQPY